ncbi:nucleoid-associated protein NdpA [Vibrio ishigakensis]|uniref:Nucleoid-associated protein NdpA n=1 Tax=Vibrio ishigakensis TaxID=1481914 RepID=A0A0B8PT68_9VIBR|nr:nucleoid-associated protein NdpA [Vibrio ishigakensis]
MSLQLSNVILHQLVKDADQQLEVKFRESALTNDASSESLVAELHRVFNAKAGKGFGSFGEESEFQGWLNEMLAQDLDFTLSHKIVPSVWSLRLLSTLSRKKAF